MKRIWIILVSAVAFTACGNNSNSDANMKDPSEVQPPSEALPDTMQLKNDSVVVPDSAPDAGVKARVGASDSIQRHR